MTSDSNSLRPCQHVARHRPYWPTPATVCTGKLVALCSVGLLAATAHSIAADDSVETASPLPQLVVELDFANGNGQVELLDQKTRTIRLRPIEHPQRGWACWWYIKVTGIRPGETITLDVGKAPWATPTRAAFSLDNCNWRQTTAGTRQQNRIVYRQRVDANEAWFAWGPPFGLNDAIALTEWAAGQIPQTQAFVLGQTRGGQSIPALHVGATSAETGQPCGPPQDGAPPQHDPPHTVWIQARQHAWEAGSSWVCKGLVNWLASADPRVESLRNQAQLFIVPIMDVDNVQLGAGGKNQHPQDHNRDWSDAPHWPAVRAATDRIRALDREGRFDVFVDLHNPGAQDAAPFFFVSPRKLLTDKGQRNLSRLLAAAEVEIVGPLAFTGIARESGPGYDANWRQISKNWVSFNTREHVVAVTLETTWNSAESTITGYETVGRQLGRALQRYLETAPRRDN